MTKAKRSIDQDLGTKVAFNGSMSLCYTIVGASKRTKLQFMSSCSNSRTLVTTPKYLNNSFVHIWLLPLQNTWTPAVKGGEEFAGRSNSRCVINRRKLQGELNETVMHEKGIKTIMTPLLTSWISKLQTIIWLTRWVTLNQWTLVIYVPELSRRDYLLLTE